MEIEFSQMLVLFACVFLGGLVDSIAGGGGLITLPAYYAVGIPAHMALGTNKVSSGIGTAVPGIDYDDPHALCNILRGNSVERECRNQKQGNKKKRFPHSKSG